MRKNNLPLISVAFIFVTLLSMWLYPAASSPLGSITLVVSLALSTYTIFQTHAGTEKARAKILKEAGVMVLTLIIILFLGGIAAMLANCQIGVMWGEMTEIVSAIGASFGVGYFVHKGMGRLT